MRHSSLHHPWVCLNVETRIEARKLIGGSYITLSIWSNEQSASKRSFVSVFIKTTGFCDIGITSHTKLAVYFY